MRSLVPLVLLSAACTPTEVELTGTVSDVLLGGGLDAEVCLADNCVQTASDGSFTLEGAPVDADVLLTVTSGNHAPAAFPIVLGTEDLELPAIEMIGNLAYNAQFTVLDLDNEPQTGAMAFAVVGNLSGGSNIAGVTAGLDPDDGDGPFYQSSLGVPTVDERETTDNGGGVWLNLPPGAYSVDLDNVPDGCTRHFGWGGIDNLDFQVLSGFATVLRIECPL